MEFIYSREEYEKGTLDREDLLADPFAQAARWLKDADVRRIVEPYAMTLATADEKGKPSARTVLLRRFDGSGFLFFTHYTSRKGRELEKNPSAVLLFFWKELERQLIVEGVCKKADPSLSDAYFETRPRESRISARASKQDSPLPSRDALEEQFQMEELKFRNKKVPRPPNWGGYILQPERFEFWQGRKMRLHDRFEYLLQEGEWKISRLAP